MFLQYQVIFIILKLSKEDTTKLDVAQKNIFETKNIFDLYIGTFLLYSVLLQYILKLKIKTVNLMNL